MKTVETPSPLKGKPVFRKARTIIAVLVALTVLTVIIFVVQAATIEWANTSTDWAQRLR